MRPGHLICDALPALGLLSATAVVGTAAWQVEGALGAAAEVHRYQEAVLASIQAEAAAFHATEQLGREGVEGPSEWETSGQLAMRTQVRLEMSRGWPELQITVHGDGGRRHRFAAPVLAGAAPRCLGYSLSLPPGALRDRPGLRAWLEQNLQVAVHPIPDGVDFADLLDPELAPARSWSGVLADPSLALVHLARGTDRADFVPSLEQGHIWRPDVPAPGVVSVDGNLWFAPQARPLIVELSAPLTILVEGNVYIDRSIVVRGAGSLSLVARAGGSSRFIDADGDGAWSQSEVPDGAKRVTGPVEGGGNLYVGRHVPAGRALAIGANLLGVGELYLSASRANLQAATVVLGGITWLREAGILEMGGEQLRNVQRHRLPGFAVRGGLRPGLVRPR